MSWKTMNQSVVTRNLNSIVLEANLKTGEIIRHEYPVRFGSKENAFSLKSPFGMKS